VNQDTATILLDLNQRFYQTFAAAFSSTRGRAQPGVRRVAAGLREDESVLDLGCGNGTLAAELALLGKRCAYLGIDSSAPLLEVARRRSPGGLKTGYLEADLAGEWAAAVRAQTQRPFTVITSFAVLHHIPGMELRLRILRQAHALLAPSGRFIHSEWQFTRSRRLRERISAWEEVGLSQAQVDAGDALIDWRAGGRGLRYVHQFTPEELDQLAAQAGFRILETFASDGASRDLSLYQIWEKSAL
jgi:2-polyprenyl-3-methyl-5-hydroxy-6-metoxy-1,4-benzoquinol methylase